jgi:hypothetical protein
MQAAASGAREIPHTFVVSDGIAAGLDAYRPTIVPNDPAALRHITTAREVVMQTLLPFDYRRLEDGLAGATPVPIALPDDFCVSSSKL